jgi:glycine/D-amino acid oxidase-like deaminating enzyme
VKGEWADNEANPEFDRELYRRRTVIGRLVGWLKECGRVFSQFEKTAVNIAGTIEAAIIQPYLRTVCPEEVSDKAQVRPSHAGTLRSAAAPARIYSMHLRASNDPFRTVEPAITPSGDYRPVSFWQQTVDVAPGDRLEGETSCDVAIIGGGFTGLSTGLALKRAAADLDVVILERDVVGHGASGRNGGFAMPLLGWDLTDAAHKLGEQGAGEAYRLMYEAVDSLKRTVAEEKIDCDLESTGYLLLATCASAERRLKEEARLGERLGFEHQWLDPVAVEAHVKSATFRGGVYDPRPAIVNPAKLARGLKRVAETNGVRIYEQTGLVELVDGEPVRICTPSGEVRTRAVVLAVNGYGAALGLMPQRVLPVHTYIVLTEPLSDAQLEEIGWLKRRTSLETARNLIHYFRLTADNRILMGGEDAKLFWGGRYRDTDPTTFRLLERRLKQFFPSLTDVQFTHRWGGVLGVTIDMFPTFGTGGEHGSIFHASGYSGHGVSLSNYAGHVLAPHVLRQLGKFTGNSEPATPFFYGRKPMWLPPDPMRWAGMQVYRWVLNAQDRWRGA